MENKKEFYPHKLKEEDRLLFYGKSLAKNQMRKKSAAALDKELKDKNLQVI